MKFILHFHWKAALGSEKPSSFSLSRPPFARECTFPIRGVNSWRLSSFCRIKIQSKRRRNSRILSLSWSVLKNGGVFNLVFSTPHVCTFQSVTCHFVIVVYHCVIQLLQSASINFDVMLTSAKKSKRKIDIFIVKFTFSLGTRYFSLTSFKPLKISMGEAVKRRKPLCSFFSHKSST